MAEDKSKEILEHLTTWLSRQKNAASLVPEVQRLKEEAEWQHQTWFELKASVPAEVSSEVDGRLDRQYSLIKSNIPLPPDYSPLAMATVATSTSSSTMATYSAVLKIEDLNQIPPEQAEPYLVPYRALQAKYNRRSEVRNLLERKLPSLTPQFARSAAAYDTAKSQPEQIPAAALELRNLIDKFKGELFERARCFPRENMTWPVMAERLGVIPDSIIGGLFIRDQESDRSNIFDRLSRLIKRRQDLEIRELEALWPLVLDHLFIVCKSIRD